MTKGIQSWKHLSLSKSLPRAEEKCFYLGWNFVFIIVSEKSSFDVVGMFISTDAVNVDAIGLHKSTVLLAWLPFLYSGSLLYEIFELQAVQNAIALGKWVLFLNCSFTHCVIEPNQSSGNTLLCQFYSLVKKNSIYFFCHRSIWTSADLWSSIHLATLTPGVRVLQVMTLFFLPIQCLMNPVFPSTNTWMGALKHEKKQEHQATYHIQNIFSPGP